MASFEKAIQTVLDHEGGYANNPNDPGGPTKYGLSSRFLQGKKEFDLNHDGKVSAEEIKAITEPQAEETYKKYFWDAYGYSRIYSDNIAKKLLDICINIGQIPGIKLMQAACNKILFPKSLILDGIMGSKTIEAINACDELRLLNNFRINCSIYYNKITKNNPRLSNLTRGLLKRADA